MTLYESYKLSNYSGTYAQWLEKMEDEAISLDHSLEYDPEDCCPDIGKPHLYIETYYDERKQILTCKVCGYQSVGWYEQEKYCCDECKDISYDPEDCCPDIGKPHLYIETYCDERKQILTCKVCGYQSVGWYEQRE